MMARTFPDCVQKYLAPLPLNKTDPVVIKNISKFRDLYGDDYVNSIIWTQDDAKAVLDELGIQAETAFYYFYLNSFELPDGCRAENLYGLSEVLADYKNPFWARRYPGIENRYLQLSSIEGEYSYFYDKSTDNVFGADWGEMDKFVAGNLPPLFESFDTFLAWYFSDESAT